MLVSEINVNDHRKAENQVDSLFLNRWSPRAMSGDEITERELMSLFEAARWAPSSYNGQPWRFFYARRNGPHWDDFFNLMIEFNQSWTQNAAVLIVIVSRKTFERNDKPSRTHSMDTGAAWQNLALQGSLKGLVVHGMEGFDYDRARSVLKLPDHYQVEAMAAVGRPGRKEDLDKDTQEREIPSDRKTVQEFAFEGPFAGERKK